jgi:hypothetical protein
MALIVVERSFAEAQKLTDLQSRLRAVAFCFSTYRVKFLQTFFALDGKHMLCLYEAADAEAVRSVQRTAGLPIGRVWGASAVWSERAEAPPDAPVAVLQRALPPDMTDAQVRQLEREPVGCAGGELIATFVSRDVGRMCAAFYSSELDSIAAHNREAGLPFESVWAALRFQAPG